MSQPLILVADDEPKIRRLLSINLASLGYEVICAVDGPSALQVFEDHQPDLVLLDIMMPGLDGYDVLTICPNPLRWRNSSAAYVPF